MNPKLLKRLERLEQAVNGTTVPMLTFVDIHALRDADRDRYWAGDGAVLGLPDTPGVEGIRAVIIDIHPACRESWLETRGMSDEALERYEEGRDREEARPDRNERPPEPEPRFDRWGYRIP